MMLQSYLHFELDGAMVANEQERLSGTEDDRVCDKHALDLLNDILRSLGACVLHPESKAKGPGFGGCSENCC